jgi:hypothetical protein
VRLRLVIKQGEVLKTKIDVWGLILTVGKALGFRWSWSFA